MIMHEANAISLSVSKDRLEDKLCEEMLILIFHIHISSSLCYILLSPWNNS